MMADQFVLLTTPGQGRRLSTVNPIVINFCIQFTKKDTIKPLLLRLRLDS